MYVVKDDILRISVRNLVEFIYREGDIDSGEGSFPDVKAMQEGARIHRKLQKSMGSNYHAEVPLKISIPVDNGNNSYTLCIEGRADGIICDLNEDEDGNRVPLTEVVIDEIKTTRAEVLKMSEAVYVHKAQAICYAYMYALKQSLECISVQMTYCNPDTEEIKRFKEEFSMENLQEWFNGLIEAFKKWSDFVFNEREKRQKSIKDLQFPYEYRKGQRNLVVNVYRSVENAKNLYIQAPTGVGKTISTIFPSVMAIGQGYADKLFYLTSKTITRTVAEDTFGILKDNGLSFRVLTITAKDKICVLEERRCNPIDCPYAKGHYERVNEAVFDLINNCDVVNREAVLRYADKHKVCPFEMSLDASYWCDGIICDYNYVFDPDVSLKRYFSEGQKADYIFLVDEAHNLVDRARDMYSATIRKESFLKAKRLIKDRDKRLAAALEACNKEMLELKRQCDTYCVIDNAGKLPLKLERAYSGIQKFFEKNKGFEDKDELMEIFFEIRHFLNMYDSMDGGYVIYTEHNSDNEFCMRLFCVDPSGNISLRLSQGRSTVFFSATLLPVNFFKEMLSGEINDMAVYAESSFEPENRCVLVGSDVSSRYNRRGREEYRKISSYIYKTIQAQKGKYMVFFPSYSFMEAVFDEFDEIYSPHRIVNCKNEIMEEMLLEDGIHVVVQGRGMDEYDREKFLKLFEEGECGGSLVGFCVNGGVFSEGIDLKKESLIGAVIVGTGLPMICRERDILKNYFDECGKDGYAYAYVYPGMNKVLQAAGRVIRTNEDRGIIELLDDRFLTASYKALYPREWNNVITTTLSGIYQNITDFWKK